MSQAYFLLLNKILFNSKINYLKYNDHIISFHLRKTDT